MEYGFWKVEVRQCQHIQAFKFVWGGWYLMNRNRLNCCFVTIIMALLLDG